MDDLNKQVMEMVQSELVRYPESSTSELYALAKMIAPEIGELSVRQFHALYPLRVQRERAAGGKSTRKSTRKKRSDSGTRRGGRKTTRKTTTTRKSASEEAPAEKATRKKTTRKKTTRKKTGRKQATPKTTTTRKTTAAPKTSVEGGNRDAVRAEMMAFAQDLSSSVQDPVKLVKLFADIDRYVDRVIAATRG